MLQHLMVVILLGPDLRVAIQFSQLIAAVEVANRPG
jgi:hypothetical protein